MLVFNISLCVYVIIYLLYEIYPFQDLILSLNNIEQSTALFTVQNTSITRFIIFTEMLITFILTSTNEFDYLYTC